MKLTASELLDRAEVKFELYGHAKGSPVYLAMGQQLIGTYADLEHYRALDGAANGNAWHQGWQAHHIVEEHDLGRLHIKHRAPSRDDQLCVLLPERAHIGRINSVLRSVAPLRDIVSAEYLLKSYKEAYDLIDDYSGGGQVLIKRELVSIVHATFRAYQLI